MKTVGIIGNEGKFGLFLERLFIEYGCKVIGSDAKNSKDISQDNIKVVTESDIVVFAIPPRNTAEVMDSLVQFSRPAQLWMDVTSIKQEPVKAMLKSRAAVLGTHPMCAPSVKSLRGQKLVVCPMRLNDWHDWIGKFLIWTGAKVLICSPEKHDRVMARVQGLVHALSLTLASTLRSTDTSVHETLNFASQVYRIALSLPGRILKQDASLYADIQMLNPEVLPVLKQATAELNRLIEIVEKGDREEFERRFALDREHFGERELADAYNLFDELSQLLAARSSENQIILKTKKDRIGLLHEITGIFLEAGVNITDFHSFSAGEGNRFLVVLDHNRNSTPAQYAIIKIRNLDLAATAED